MRDLSKYEMWYGRDDPPPQRQVVRAGRLVGELEGVDLRYLRFGGGEIVRRVYAAIRDRNWGTVVPTLTDVQVDAGESSFGLRFDAENVNSALGVDFSWRGEILGAEDGSITLSLDGISNIDMLYNRIGWCVLHPAENAGRPFRAWTPQGQLEGRLPFAIGPQLVVGELPKPLFPAFERLEIEVTDGTWACFEFEGGLFEVEDQRNWTDASFKAYSTPLQDAFPHTAKAGERTRQSVRLTVHGVEKRARGVRRAPVVTLGAPSGPLPAIGVCSARNRMRLTSRSEELLAAACFDHLRVDIELDRPSWRRELADAVSTAAALNAALELAVFVPEEVVLLNALASALREAGVAVARILAFRRGEPTSSARTVSLVRTHLAEAVGDAAVVGGTNVLFTDINRSHPDIRSVDGIAWPLNATVHACDDASVVETAAMHGETLRSARAFCGDRSLHVTPITFNLRFNPYATGPIPAPAPGELPAQVDPRQPSLLGAGWSVATLRHLAEGGATSVTYFETVGWLGLIEREDTPVMSKRFASWPGMVFPAYHVLADVGCWRGGAIIPLQVTHPFLVEALAVRTQAALHLLVASLVPTPQRCRIDGVLPGGVASLRVLDERSFVAACSDPEAFRAHFVPLTWSGASLELELLPYAVARIDVSDVAETR